MMKQAQASEDHIKSTVSQELHDLHEQFHRAGCSTETPLSRGRKRKKRRGIWMEHRYLLGTFVISLLSKKSLYSSQQAHVEAVFLFYRWRIWDSADFPKTTKLKSSRAEVWLRLEACTFFTETLSSSWQECFRVHGWWLLHVIFPTLLLTLPYTHHLALTGVCVYHWAVCTAGISETWSGPRGAGCSALDHMNAPVSLCTKTDQSS